MSVVLCAAFFFVVGIGAAWLMPTYQSNNTALPRYSLRLPAGQYQYINPLLLCNVNQQKDLDEDKPLAQTVNQFTRDRITRGLADDLSVYIINYHTGQWVGVNENDKYDPASMLKVPLMIAYYQAAEKNPSILDQKISFNGDDQNIGEYFKSSDDIKPGQAYSTNDLIQSMIINSDNTAAVLLTKNIDSNSLSDIYTDLGLPVPVEGANVQYLSAKLYADFFRILYNATYLSRDYSQKALELLSNPDFPQGIRAGIPTGTIAAQKFGERSVYDGNNVLQSRELHDCGIVYKPDAPYLICIMSRSKTASFDTLAKNISDLSALVYKNIN